MLWWRLEHIAATLLQQCVPVAALPGARFPPGFTLPAGFPFEVHGHFSERWDSACFLLSPELANIMVELDYDGDSLREFWIRLPPPDPAQAGVTLCAMYPKHGGDVSTWESILHNLTKFNKQYPHDDIYLLGDGNTHLSYLVLHHDDCQCLHCAQNSADKRIEQILQQHSVFAYNPLIPTHDSDTTIDLILGTRPPPVPTDVLITRWFAPPIIAWSLLLSVRPIAFPHPQSWVGIVGPRLRTGTTRCVPFALPLTTLHLHARRPRLRCNMHIRPELPNRDADIFWIPACGFVMRCSSLLGTLAVQ